MEFNLSKESPEEIKCDLIAIACFEEDVGSEKKAPPAKLLAKLLREDGGTELDRALDGEISGAITASSFTGSAGKMKLFYTEGRIPARHVLLVGLGKKKDATLHTIRTAAARVGKAADEIKAKHACLMLHRKNIADSQPAARLKAIVEGIILGRYSFDMYKAEASRPSKTLRTVTILAAERNSTLKKAIEVGTSAAMGTVLARNLGNTPGNDMTPKVLATFARDVAKKGKLTYKELSPVQIKRERMGAFLSVAQGSPQPPTFVHIRYKPTKASRAKVAVVGKGVTFDTGGISIKPVRSMDEMKGDMGGAGAVIGLMKAVAELKPSVTVDAYIMAAENMPDGKAVKPGDIVTARNGKTIEYISTDAEGRMILADGLCYAAEKKPDYLIDIATLTGTCPYAVGEKYSAVMGTDQGLIDRLIKAGNESGDHLWQLPLEKDYMKGLTATVADLKNLGSSKADTVNGGLFLMNFVDDVPWAHLDIASTGWSNEVTDLSPKGATGSGTRLLLQFLMNF